MQNTETANHPGPNCHCDWCNMTDGAPVPTSTNRTAHLRQTGLTVVLGLAFALMLALPASAADCQNIDLVTGNASGNNQTVHTGIVGPLLWVNTGELEADADLGVGSISHEIPAGAIGATACPDGSVSFNVPDPASVPVVVDVEPVERWTPEEEAEYVPTPAVTNGLVFGLAA